LVTRKRAEPTDDLLSDLAKDEELSDDELAGMGFLLLIAGHETTANMLALGTFALLEHPEQAALLRADAGLIPNAVEELLRYLSIIHIGARRVAAEDIDLDGRLIKAGDPVVISVAAANRDASKFDDPGELDVTRRTTGHLTFGHGVHQCLGQQLARIEMRIGFESLLRRYPGLRLAVKPSEVPLRTDMAIYGVHELPVTW
ncbi:MAG: cytochrome P450, partial [Stackebrandtia sp.]